MTDSMKLRLKESAAEAVGTFMLVLLGLGAVHVAVLTEALPGLWQVAAVWGLGIGLAIYCTAAISGAHLNPAVTLAFCLYRGHPWASVPHYVGAQLLGAIAAATLLYALFSGTIAAFEATHGLTRGEPGSQRSAMVYGEYFPNPAIYGTTDPLTATDNATVTDMLAATGPLTAFAQVGHGSAFAAEALGTAVLVFVIFALTDPRNPLGLGPPALPFAIGFTVAALICVLAPLSQGGFNPARDFGPRLVAWCAGWGPIAIPGPRGGFFHIYILGPLIGGAIGGLLWQHLLRHALPCRTTLAEGDNAG